MTTATTEPRTTDALSALRRLGVDLDTSTRRRAEYSYDASNYRLVPLAVVFPRTAQQVAAIVATCHRHTVPVTARGGGTSMAGGAVGRGVVLDFSRHMNAVLSVDPASRRATAEPGVVLTALRSAVHEASAGALTYAPDPSSQTRATLGGTIATEACGNHSVRHGRTADHVLALDLVTADGLRLTATNEGLHATVATDRAAVDRAQQLTNELRALVHDHLSEFRLELGRIPRQVSGFHLSHLLPEHGFDMARALVGSEGTCAIVVAATVQLVPVEPAALLVAVGYNDVVEAARDVTTILEFGPAAIEGIDEVIVDTMRELRGADAVLGLSQGRAWLYVDLDGADAAKVEAKAAELLDRLRANGRMVDGRAVPDPVERASLWRVREDGAGLSSRLPSGDQSWPGWEDTAVAPDRLADYLHDFRTLLERFGLHGVMYGHFGAGCMHVRVSFDLRTESGRAVMTEFVRAGAELVVRHGGSLSGEHGDGRARSELLPIMYSPRMLTAFERFAGAWDPDRVLNPGVLVHPEHLGDNLALDGVPERGWRTSFDLAPSVTSTTQHHGDDFAHAVQACTKGSPVR
ncbi:MAG: FAD-binding oxidoreductase [Microbacterium sp.]